MTDTESNRDVIHRAFDAWSDDSGAITDERENTAERGRRLSPQGRG